jgi:hypothetical protein
MLFKSEYLQCQRTFYRATLADGVASGEPTSSPEIDKTPPYYSKPRLPGWFKLVSIDELSEKDFVNNISEVPIGESTFFEVLDVLISTES